MTYKFKLQQSFCLILYLVVLHMLVVICIYKFLVPENVKIVLMMIAFLSVCRYFHQYRYETFNVYFHPLTQKWSASKNNQKPKMYDQIRTVYLNQKFLWVILESSKSEKLSLMTSAESMTDDKYRQLRRYIISPELFK